MSASPFSLTSRATVLPRLEIWITAIREGFIVLLPLTMLGALALVLAEVAPRIGQAAGGERWPDLTTDLTLLSRRIHAATMGIMGFAGAASIAVRASALLCARDLALAPPPMGVAALAGSAFLVIVVQDLPADLSALGYSHILQGIAAGLVTAEITCGLARHRRRRTTADPPDRQSALHQSLRLCWTAALVLWLVGLASQALGLLLPPAWAALGHGLGQVLQWLQPGAVALNVVMAVLNQVAWLFGVNGGQLLLDFGGSGQLPLAGPRVLWHPAQASPMFMNAFGHLGGAGATWGLILAVLWRSRDAGLRRLSLLSIGPGLLNVNETLLFGLPLIFSRQMLLPFLLVPAFNVLLAGGLVSTGLLPLDGTAVVWSTPVVASGMALTGSIWGSALQVGLIGLDALLYAPFLARLEALRRARCDRDFKATLDVLMGPTRLSERLIDRVDPVGELARRLIDDFTRDLRANRVNLAYQPQHDMHDRVVGVEALTRWHHRHYGPIPAAAIINIAEECDLIHELGRWVLQRSCRDLAELRRAGLGGFTMSFNMSPLQLESAGCAEAVAAALKGHGLQPDDIDIEITEGRQLSTSPQSDLTLSELQRLGVRLSMDDFGMGCASLLYMQRFRMHAIKLDGSLTRDVLHNRVNQDIIQSVIRLGHAQGVMVIAEFVESTQQRDLLLALGCDCFQGWLYSQALPLAELRTYLSRGRTQPMPLVWRVH